MSGPSTQDCEKSFARTGLESVNLQRKKGQTPALQIVISVEGLRATLSSNRSIVPASA